MLVCAMTCNEACQAEHLASDLELIPILSTRLAKAHDGPPLGVSFFCQIFAKEPHSGAGLNEFILYAGHDLPLLLCMYGNKTSCITLHFLNF